MSRTQARKSFSVADLVEVVHVLKAVLCVKGLEVVANIDIPAMPLATVPSFALCQRRAQELP